MNKKGSVFYFLLNKKILKVNNGGVKMKVTKILLLSFLLIIPLNFAYSWELSEDLGSWIPPASSIPGTTDPFLDGNQPAIDNFVGSANAASDDDFNFIPVDTSNFPDNLTMPDNLYTIDDVVCRISVSDSVDVIQIDSYDATEGLDDINFNEPPVDTRYYDYFSGEAVGLGAQGMGWNEVFENEGTGEFELSPPPTEPSEDLEQVLTGEQETTIEAYVAAQGVTLGSFVGDAYYYDSGNELHKVSIAENGNIVHDTMTFDYTPTESYASIPLAGAKSIYKYIKDGQGNTELPGVIDTIHIQRAIYQQNPDVQYSLDVNGEIVEANGWQLIESGALLIEPEGNIIQGQGVSLENIESELEEVMEEVVYSQDSTTTKDESGNWYYTADGLISQDVEGRTYSYRKDADGNVLNKIVQDGDSIIVYNGNTNVNLLTIDTNILPSTGILSETKIMETLLNTANGLAITSDMLVVESPTEYHFLKQEDGEMQYSTIDKYFVDFSGIELPGGESLEDLVVLENMRWDFENNKLIIESGNIALFITKDKNICGYLNNNTKGLAIWQKTKDAWGTDPIYSGILFGESVSDILGTTSSIDNLNISLDGSVVKIAGVEKDYTIVGEAIVAGGSSVPDDVAKAIESLVEALGVGGYSIDNIAVENGRYIYAVSGNEYYVYVPGSGASAALRTDESLIHISDKGITLYKGDLTSVTASTNAAGIVGEEVVAALISPDTIPSYQYGQAVLAALEKSILSKVEIAQHIEIADNGLTMKLSSVEKTVEGITTTHDYDFKLSDDKTSVIGSSEIVKSGEDFEKFIIDNALTITAEMLESLGLGEGTPALVFNSKGDWSMSLGSSNMRIYQELDSDVWRGIVGVSNSEIRFYRDLQASEINSINNLHKIVGSIAGEFSNLSKLSYNFDAKTIILQTDSEGLVYRVFRLGQNTEQLPRDILDAGGYGSTFNVRDFVCEVDYSAGTQVKLTFGGLVNVNDPISNPKTIAIGEADYAQLGITGSLNSQALKGFAASIYGLKENTAGSEIGNQIILNINNGYKIIDLKESTDSNYNFEIGETDMFISSADMEVILSKLGEELIIEDGQTMSSVDLGSDGILSNKVYFDTTNGRVKVEVTTTMADGSEREGYQARVFDASGADITTTLDDREKLSAKGLAYEDAKVMLDLFQVDLTWDDFTGATAETISQDISGQTMQVPTGRSQIALDDGTTIYLDGNNKLSEIRVGRANVSTTDNGAQVFPQIRIKFEWDGEEVIGIEGLLIDTDASGNMVQAWTIDSDNSLLTMEDGNLSLSIAADATSGSGSLTWLLGISGVSGEPVLTSTKEYTDMSGDAMIDGWATSKTITEEYKRGSDSWQISSLQEVFSDDSFIRTITYDVNEEGESLARNIVETKDGEQIAARNESIAEGTDGDFLAYRNGSVGDSLQVIIAEGGTAYDIREGEVVDVAGTVARTLIQDTNGLYDQDAYALPTDPTELAAYYKLAIENTLQGAGGLTFEAGEMEAIAQAFATGGLSAARAKLDEILSSNNSPEMAAHLQKEVEVSEQTMTIKQYLMNNVLQEIADGKKVYYAHESSHLVATQDPTKAAEGTNNPANNPTNPGGGGSLSPGGAGQQQPGGDTGKPTNPAGALGNEIQSEVDKFMRQSFTNKVANCADEVADEMAKRAGLASGEEWREEMLALTANDARKMYLSGIGLEETQIQHLMSIMGDQEAAIAYLMKVLGITEEEAAALYELLLSLTEEDAIKMYLEKLGYTDEEVTAFIEMFNKMRADMEQYLRETLGITDEDLIEELLGMSKEDAEDKLKEEGYTDEEITAYFEMQDET
ncbi:MAG: hypothetical protein P9M06_02595, partial [Candidatus Saelkia tenebricola]|nr:hypothetical protein [Candidatus Saelkia tenebricola]